MGGRALLCLQVLFDQPLDARYGFVVLAGMEVRTRSGDFLGKVWSGQCFSGKVPTGQGSA